MPPRKAASKGTVIRRVTKTVVTEEVIEEIVTPKLQHTTKPAKRVEKTAVAKKPVAKASKDKKTTPAKKAKVKPTAVKKEKAEQKKEPTKKATKKKPIVRKRVTAAKKMGDKASAKEDKSLAVNPAIVKNYTKAAPKKRATTKAASSRKAATAGQTAKLEAAILSDASVTAGVPASTFRTKQTARKPTASSLSAALARVSSAAHTARPMPPAKHMKRTTRKSSGAQTPAEASRQKWQDGPPVPMPRAKRMKQTARKSSGAQPPAQAARQRWQGGTPMPDAKRVKQTARKSGSTACASITPSQSTAGQAAQNESYVWELTHESGYFPDGFHSYMEPTKRNLGSFTTREAAVRKGKSAIGSNVGYSWKEVREGGDLETVSDSDTRWEMCWSPPDSEYSRVCAHRITVAAGRWVVDVEQGYPADGFHSYSEPTKKQLGPYMDRAVAVRIAKQQVGKVYGINWDEVVEGGELEVVEDSSHKWEVSWTPPDSEYSHVVARMLTEPQVGEMGNGDESGNEESDSDDDDEFYRF